MSNPFGYKTVGRGGDLSLRQALSGVLDRTSFDSGQLEGVRERLSQQSEMIAMLVELLERKDVIDKSDIERLLGYGHEVLDDLT